MAFTSPTFLAVVLTLLAMGVMSGTQAKPVEQSIPVLDITSNIKLDKPIFGDKFGPFTAGQELTLICSTKASDSVSLSWWEGDTEQQSSAKVDDGLISSSFTIQTLRMDDNGRRFSCKDQQTQAIKHFEIIVETDPTTVLVITKDGEPIKNGAVVQGTEGEEFKLICIVQGYNPLAVSWWEGGAELEFVLHKSTYATSNVLSVKAITVDDSRRTFTCRSLNGQLSKTVTLEVAEGTSNVLDITKDGKPIEDGAVVGGNEGEDFTLICIEQGYNPHEVSWWEGGAELESVAHKSTYATSNVLSVKAITVDDSRRTFTCRSLNGQLSKTVTLEVAEGMFITQAYSPGAMILTIVLLVLLVLFIVSLFVMTVLISKYCANKKVVEGRKDEVSTGNQVFSAVVKDNSLVKVSNEKKYNKLINNSNESVSEHEEV